VHRADIESRATLTHRDDETDGSHLPWSGRRMRLREAVRSAARTRKG
jgi:hypothetical protein